MGLDPRFGNIAHTASSLTVTWLAHGTGWQGGTDESWGIDNVEVLLNGVPDIDLAATSLAWNTAQGGVDYAYTISGGDLPQGATGALYWSTDTDFNQGKHSRIDKSVFTTATAAQSNAYTGHIDAATLGTPPTDASYQYLLFVLNSDDAVTESDGPFARDPNNVQSLALKPDLSVVDLVYNSAGVGLVYEVDGAPLPAKTIVEYDWASGANVSQKLGPAADPVVLPAGTSVGAHDGAGVLAGDLRLPPPSGTTHLLVLLDPSNLIGDPTPNDNIRAIPVHFGPSVQVNERHLDGTLVTDAAPLTMNESYTVEVTIINYDSLPHSYHVHWAGVVVTPVGGLTPSFALPQDFDTDPILPDSSAAWTSYQFHYQWNWIPKQNPITALESVLSISLDTLKEALSSKVLDKLLKAVEGMASTATDVITELVQLATDFKDMNRNVQVNYTAVVDDGSNRASATAGARLTVTLDKAARFALFEASDIAASEMTGAGLGSLIPGPTFDPVLSVIFFVSEVSSLGIAHLFYDIAADPPDSDFTQVVTPQTIKVPEVEAMVDGPLKEYAHTALSILGLRSAEATSLNRADAARQAGQANWQSAQLLAAATYASEAVELETRMVHLQQLLSPYITRVASGLAPNWIDYLRTKGLPDLEVRLLTQLGWTSEMIESVRQDLIQHGAEAVANPALNDLALSLSTLLGSYTAYSNLEQAIEVRAKSMGLPVQAPTSEQLQGLNDHRAAIEARLSRGVPSDSLYGAIQTYIKTVQGLIQQTNNFPALKDALDFGFTALVEDHGLDAGTKGLNEFIQALETSGRIGSNIASQLQDHVATAQGELATGNFDQAFASLSSMSRSIRGFQSAGLAPEIASDLMTYTEIVQSSIPSASQSAPTVQALQRIGFHAQPTQVVLTFTGHLDPGTTANLVNYHILSPGRDGGFGTRDDRTIAIASATYDPATKTVTLTPKHRLNLHRRYMLILNGSTPTGISDVSGNLLDGNGDGKPGGDYVATLRGFGLDRPGVPFGRLIREQLGGKPLSSRRLKSGPPSLLTRMRPAIDFHTRARPVG
jgi:hypothetical protein